MAKQSASKNKTKKQVIASSICDSKHLESMLKQAEDELEWLEPKISKLEAQIEKLAELRHQKQKLITLKLSLKSILSTFESETDDDKKSRIQALVHVSESVRKDVTKKRDDFTTGITKTISSQIEQTYAEKKVMENRNFYPDKAFNEAGEYLKRKTSFNYEIFRAVVFSGGQASTDEIKRYLIENNIKMPGNGKSVSEVPKTDLSSRINYLVRKGLLTSTGRGQFMSLVGWEQS